MILIQKIFLILFALWPYPSRADLAHDLLISSDQGRGGFEQGLSWKIKIETHEDGEKNIRDFNVRAKGSDAYVEALAPARNKGEIYLFNDRTMWFFKPSLRKPVAISAKQKLTGQAANGDIASNNYAKDYNPTMEKKETIKGEKLHVLFLKAKSDQMTYDQIRYWVSAKTKLALKAEFLTIQGKPFKRAYFEYKNKLKIGGQTRSFISAMKIVDAQFENNWSIIRYGPPKIDQQPPGLFQVNSLTR